MDHLRRNIGRSRPAPGRWSAVAAHPSLDQNEGCPNQRCADAAAFAYRAVAPVAFLGYACLVYVTYTEYGVDGTALWGAVWSGAGPSVAFMTIDAIVLYVAVCLYIAFRDVGGAIKAVALTPVVGPGAAIAIVMAALEEEPFALASKLD